MNIFIEDYDDEDREIGLEDNSIIPIVIIDETTDKVECVGIIKC